MFTRYTALWLLGALAPLQLAAQDLKKTSPYESAHFDLFHPVPRNQLRELRPDRPGVTESPFTVDAGHFQLETDALRLINTREDTMHSRDFHVAYAVAKMGLSRRTDLQVEVPLYSIGKQRGEHQSSWDKSQGFGDLAIRVKHNFLGDDQESPIAMGVVAYTRLPTSKQARNGAIEGGLILPVNIMLPHKWNLDVQIESDLNYDREQQNHYVRVMPSVALDHEFSDLFSFLVEGVTQWDAEHSGWRSSINMAPIFNINKNMQADFGAHLALSKEMDREFFVGFTFRR
jgi:hypothetical protein